MSSLDLSIIIVNWNSKDFLKKCIATILNNTQSIEFEIIVIDNASFDGCCEMLSQYYPKVRFIQSDINLGFAKANNEAFKISIGRNLLFLNPDTEIEGCGIETLFHQIDYMPSTGILGAKLLNSDRSIQTSCVQSFPKIINQILDVEALHMRFPRSSLWGIAPLFKQDNSPTEVEVVSGACIMIKRIAFEAVGMFSEDYFMYSEDVDLCLKVQKVGLKNYFVPTAVIIHHGGRSSANSSGSTFSYVMMLESQWRFFQKTRTLWYCYQYYLMMFFISLLRIVFLLFIWPIFKVRRRDLLVSKALKKWTARLRWTLGLESWVKDY